MAAGHFMHPICYFLCGITNYICKKYVMKQGFFKFLARINKLLLPSYSKKRLDLAKASKLQLAIIGWRYYITIKALD